MSNSDAFKFPEIDDEDLRWAAVQLGLPELAFLGEQGNDPRKSVIQSKENMDVAACPGSGKTTVLIAKLAIMAKKWKYRARGICVLSHTNAARQIIETRLGNSSEGRHLLSYPHFIGTIHSFVNEFLASPWLRAQEYPIKMIDTEVCENRRWNSLAWKTTNYLGKQKITSGDIKIIDSAFNLGKKRGTFPCGPSTDSYKAVQKSCIKVAESGYHCYDDMFVWAHDMLKRQAGISWSIQYRFPILFIDEAQDNSDEQTELLKEIFTSHDSRVIRQRFGDGNQAIYDFMGAQEATTDAFPCESIRTTIPNSFRFGQTIANLSDQLGIIPYQMKGHGPQEKTIASEQAECNHTVFAFENENMSKVLDAYGNLLLDTFSDDELRHGEFTAIGMVHKQQDDDGPSMCYPHRVGDYWSDYNPKLAGVDPTPQTLVQYVRVGLATSFDASEACFAVERTAQGILRLAALGEGAKGYSGRKHRHRWVLQTIKELPEQMAQYAEFLDSYVVRREALGEDAWKSKWKENIRGIAEKICGAKLKGADVDAFLSWDSSPAVPNKLEEAQTAKGCNDNVYTHQDGGRKVSIKVGSIHSVKGQTHTATLVLDTAWYGCNLEHIVPWLSGENVGRPTKKNAARDITRLKTHYVAMTRPSHLLCLALRKKALCGKDGQIDSKLLGKLRGRGWKIVDVGTSDEL